MCIFIEAPPQLFLGDLTFLVFFNLTVCSLRLGRAVERIYKSSAQKNQVENRATRSECPPARPLNLKNDDSKFSPLRGPLNLKNDILQTAD